MSDFSQIPTVWPQATGFDSVYVAEIATIDTLNMEGPLTLAFDATLPLEAVTLQQLQAGGGGNRRIDAGVNPLGPYNQPARVNASTIGGAGAGARLLSTTLAFNTLLGYFAGNLLADGTSAENTFIGYAAGSNQPSGNFNTYIGNGAGWGINYNASLQTFIGMDVFRGSPEFGSYNTGTSNTGVGAQVFRNGNFVQSVGIGLAALRYIGTAASVTVNDCVAVGYSAMAGDATCLGTINFCVAMGWQSGNKLGVGLSSTVQANTLIGHATGQFLTNGSFDTFVGYNSGGSSAIGTVNFLTLVGAKTGENLTSASLITAVGFEAGQAVTSGSSNDLFGYQAGLLITTGNHNTIFGATSGSMLTTGFENTLIGPLVATGILSTGVNNILIGYALDTLASNTSSTINIGNTFTATSAGGPNNNGHITLSGADVAFANALISTTSAGISIDVPNQIVTAIAVAAGGTGYLVNDTLNDASGGRYNVTSVSSGAVTGLSIIKAGVAASPPSNPVTLTNGSKTVGSNQGGTGCTATLTWSANQVLLFNKSANDVFMSGALSSSAVVGFLGLPGGTGTPTGVPTNAALGPLFYYNRSSNSINVYSGGAWNHVTLSAGAG